MAEPVHIRPFAQPDRERAIDLIWQMNLHEQTVSPTRALLRSDAAATLARIEADVAEQGGHILVAELGGVIVGVLGLQFSAGMPFVQEDLRAHGYVSDLVVAEDHRGQGIGQVLLAEAERLTRARGLRVMSIGVLVGNTMAERAYRRFGFVAHSTEMVKVLA
jgi:ribosomal protein S18 acetylase RimI-like enzyme